VEILVAPFYSNRNEGGGWLIVSVSLLCGL